jgi:hypothetical protein
LKKKIKHTTEAKILFKEGKRNKREEKRKKNQTKKDAQNSPTQREAQKKEGTKSKQKDLAKLKEKESAM